MNFIVLSDECGDSDVYKKLKDFDIEAEKEIALQNLKDLHEGNKKEYLDRQSDVFTKIPYPCEEPTEVSGYHLCVHLLRYGFIEEVEVEYIEI